ncbi:hypothetical protein EJB05_47661 [Eragrostis curvula]|nr:hypothetical protein EJB05_47661 [Eragrostis curvula]
MREALGLAPKRSNRPQGNRLDKHEYAELVKRGSTAEDMGAGHAEAAQVQGLGLYKAPRDEGESSSFKLDPPEMMPEKADFVPAKQEDSEDDRKGKRRREERRGEKERKREKHAEGKERRRDKHDRRHDSEDRSKRHRKDKQKRRHDSDSD